MILTDRIEARPYESLVGFVMRAAEANHLPSVALYGVLKGRVVCPSELSEAESLAQVCGCTVPEIAQLFGFVQRRPDGVRGWKLGDEWLTQARFVSSRKMTICRECLRAEAYLPGAWELALYRACAFHRSRLVASCPGCHRPLAWTRPCIRCCGCGFDLRAAPSVSADAPSVLLAQLIERRIDSRAALTPPVNLPRPIVNCLASLTLEGLFKTIWFLGQRLGQFEACTTGYGRAKPRAEEADVIIREAFALLAGWPGALHDRLALMERRALDRNPTRLYSRAFKPMVAYLEQEFADAELAFLRRAVEQGIRRLWRARGRSRAPRELDRQLEFDLGDSHD